MIIFETPEDILPESFTIFGLNSKPNTDCPIGKFGTGLKYAIAITLRLDGEIEILTRDKEYIFYTAREEFRDQTIQSIYMRVNTIDNTSMPNRSETIQLPFTLDLGRHWKPWMAIRELEANTRDENGTSYLSEVVPIDFDGTIIRIECNDLQVEYEFLEPNVFMPKDLELIAEYNNVEIYNAASHYIYNENVRIKELTTPSVLTYNMLSSSVTLTEDRTDSNSAYTESKIVDAILHSSDIHRSLLMDGVYSFEDQILDSESLSSEEMELWFKSIKSLGIAVKNESALRAYEAYKKRKKETEDFDKSRAADKKALGPYHYVKVHYKEALLLLRLKTVPARIKKRLRLDFQVELFNDKNK